MKFLSGILLFIFLHISYSVFSQKQSVNAGTVLLKSVFDKYNYENKSKPRVLSLKDKSFIHKINPLYYLSASLLFLYQRVLSEQIQATCMYQISCSNYTRLSVEKKGFSGFLTGINQLTNCFPGVRYDYPDHKISPDLKVINIPGE